MALDVSLSKIVTALILCKSDCPEKNLLDTGLIFFFLFFNLFNLITDV